MPIQKQKKPLRYSRKKGQVEIDGDPADVKELAQAERYERITKWFILLLLFLILLLKDSMASPIWKLIEEVIKRFPLSLFAKLLLNLSG